MEKASFRDILKRMLAAEEAALASGSANKSTLSQAAPNPPPLNFHWQTSAPPFAAKKAYKQNPAKTTLSPKAAPQAKPDPAPDVLFTFAELNAADQSDAQLLIVLGADFKSGFSASRLKKEHRRLAKALHPDALGPGLTEAQIDLAREKFLILQAAYERLHRSLANLRSSGNESASASTTRRQDAA